MRPGLILFAVVLQVASLILFVVDIVASILGLFRVSWQVHEFIQIGAVLGLIIGAGISLWALLQTMRRNRRVEDQLRAASGAFTELMEDRFDGWGLTAAERDVALFSLKGVSPQEIAELRGTSEGTVKAQTNAIYRKAGVSGRPQLLSLFIEDLMEGPVGPDAQP